MEIPCVYIFDGPRKHVDLLEQLLDVSRIILRSYCWVVVNI